MLITEANRGEGRSRLLDLVFVVTQLRDMLAAENSAVVTQEDQNCWLLTPQRAELDVLTFGIR